MKRSFLVVLVASCVVGIVAGTRARAEGPAFTVEVAGVRAVWPAYKGEMSMRAMNDDEGFTLGVLVKGESIIALDVDASKVAAAKDDKEKDLTAARGWNKPQLKGGSVSKDGKAAIVEICAPNPPSRGSKSVHVEATVSVLTANGTEKKEGVVELTKDTKIEFGTEPLLVAKLEENKWNKECPHGVTLTSKKPFHWIAGIAVKDEDGKDVKTADGGGGWSDGGNGKVYEMTILMAKKLAKGTLVIEVRKDMKTVPVPVALDVSIGG